MMTSLRIISNNIVDVATVTASTTAGGNAASNVKLDKKGYVWRSTGTSATLTISGFPSTVVKGVVLPFTNLTNTATIQITGGTFDTGAVVAAPWGSYTPYGTVSIPSGANTYAYGGGTCARVWIPVEMHQSVTSITVSIVDTSNPAGYIEVSRVVAGDYWSPTYNTSYGISRGFKDSSEHKRLISGDSYTVRGTKYDTLTFDLKFMDTGDKTELIRIMKGNGIIKPLFVSIFPNNSDDYTKEQAYQIYGKLSQLDAIVHSTLEMYSTQLTLEEV